MPGRHSPRILTGHAPFIESFNSRLRDECLNEHWFQAIPDAEVLIEQGRRAYNTDHPHNSLGHRPPAEYADQCHASQTSADLTRLSA